VDARDVAAAMLSAADRAPQGSRYIVGGRFHGFAEILAVLEALTGRRGPRVRAPVWAMLAFAYVAELWARLRRRPALVTPAAIRLMNARLAVSSDKAVRELGARFRPLAVTVHDAIAWLAPGHALAPAAGLEVTTGNAGDRQ